MGKSSRRKRERQEVPLLELPSWMPRDIQIERNHGGAKISNSLHELVKPYVTLATTQDRFRMLVMLAVIGWNLSTVDEPRRTEALNRLIEETDDARPQDFTTLVRSMVTRKLTLFPDDPRFIVSWDVRLQNNNFHITAAALTPGADLAKQDLPDAMPITVPSPELDSPNG